MDYFELLDGLYDEFIFNEQEIRCNPEKADWWNVSTHLNEIPVEFIREFRDKIMWERVDLQKIDAVRPEIVNEFNRDIEDRMNNYYRVTSNDGKNMPTKWTITDNPTRWYDELIWEFNE